MRKNKVTGWKQVYQFTFLQTIKSKPIVIMTTILCCIALLSMPIMQLVSSLAGDKKESQSEIKVVYIVDESGLGQTDYNSILVNENYKSLEFQYTQKDIKELTDEIRSSDDGTVLLHITEEQGYYNLQFVKTPNGTVKDKDVEQLSVLVSDCFKQNRVNTLGISEEQMNLIQTPTITEVNTMDVSDQTGEENGNEDSKGMSMNEYYFVLFIIVIIVMFMAFGGEAVASSILTEKSTRVIELLMTSIRPLAIIIGKILAMLTVTLLQFMLIGVSIAISGVLNRAISPSAEGMPSMLKEFLTPELLSNVTPVNVILTVLVLISGFLFFALMAGLAGATVSKIEELAEGIMVFNALLVIGAYLGIAVCMIQINGHSENVVAYVAYLLPISSIFITPAYLFLGRITIVWGIASLVILILCFAGLAIFTARIYEALILHQGNRLKLKDLISISKES